MNGSSYTTPECIYMTFTAYINSGIVTEGDIGFFWTAVCASDSPAYSNNACSYFANKLEAGSEDIPVITVSTSVDLKKSTSTLSHADRTDATNSAASCTHSATSITCKILGAVDTTRFYYWAP